MGNAKVFFAVLLAGILFFSGCLKNSRPELCSEITDLTIKDSCFYGVALDKNEQSLCRQIKELEEKDNCLYDLAQGNFFQSKPVKKIFVSGPKQLCKNEMGLSEKDFCFHRQARATGNEVLCYFMSDSEKKESCLKDMEKS